MANTTLNLPTSGTSDGAGVAWSTPSNITTEANYTSSILPNSGDTSANLTGKTFGFTVPSGATINGIEIVVSASTTSTPPTQTLSLTKDGTNAVGTAKTPVFTLTIEVITFGSSSDLWGTTWTASEINSSNFGALFDITNPSSGVKVAYVDYIKAKVYYTESGVNKSAFFQFM